MKVNRYTLGINYNIWRERGETYRECVCCENVQKKSAAKRKNNLKNNDCVH